MKVGLAVPPSLSRSFGSQTVGDHVVQGAIGFHHGQVGGVEGHDRPGRQEGCGAACPGPDVGGTGLTKGVPRTVDGDALGEDEQVIDHLTLHQHGRELPDDDLRPAVGGCGQRVLLGLAEPAEKADLDGEGPRRAGHDRAPSRPGGAGPTAPVGRHGDVTW